MREKGGGKINREIGELLEKVYPLENPEGCRKRFVKRRRRNVLLTAALVLLLSFLFMLREKAPGQLGAENRLERPDFGSSRISLAAKCGEYEWTVAFELKAKKRSEQEAKELLAYAAELLKSRMLGENPSLQKVTGNLQLPDGLPEYDIEIAWKSSDKEIVSGDGSVHNRELAAAQSVFLTARLYYGETVQEYVYEVCVHPYPYTGEELLERQLLKALEAGEEETAETDYMQLPEQVGGADIVWEEENGGSAGSLLLLGAVLVFAVYGREASVLRKKKKEREEQLLMDYPEFLSRFILLIGAGITVRAAWERMLGDYKKSGRRRYVYDEMQRTMAQLEVGMPEIRAYEQFGRRCALLCYLRFTTILTQNLKKGSSGIAELLRMEADEAFSERKNQARRKGEEAGTKLLLPMGGMLVIVLVLILVPAFASFSL